MVRLRVRLVMVIIEVNFKRHTERIHRAHFSLIGGYSNECLRKSHGRSMDEA